MKLRSALFSAVLLSASLLVSLGVIELVLRVKNSSMRSYDVEMWRYSRELKVPSADPVLAFDHVKNSSALLQSVTICTNEWGLRGGAVPPRKPDTRRILFLGGSITLGWGVQEEDTISERVQRMFAEHGQRVEVLNGGIGNYNAERYVERFFTELAGLEPTDIVVQYFLRDAEHLDPGGGNFFCAIASSHSRSGWRRTGSQARLVRNRSRNIIGRHIRWTSPATRLCWLR